MNWKCLFGHRWKWEDVREEKYYYSQHGAIIPNSEHIEMRQLGKCQDCGIAKDRRVF